MISSLASTVAGVAGAAASNPGTSGSAGAAPSDPSFGDSLTALIGSVEGSAAEANTAVADMLSGQGDVHAAMLALHRAEVSMQLTVQVRNKLVQAYQDLMRMPI